jgi:hypothetical protein
MVFSGQSGIAVNGGRRGRETTQKKYVRPLRRRRSANFSLIRA